MESQMKCWHTCTIQQYENSLITTANLSVRTLPHIWREATILPISLYKRHTWKPYITHQWGRLDKKVTIMRKLAGTWSRYSSQATKEQLNREPDIPKLERIQLISIGNKCQRQPTELRYSSKPGTTHYHSSHEIDHEGTPTYSHINSCAYRTITWKANNNATSITDWRVVDPWSQETENNKMFLP